MRKSWIITAVGLFLLLGNTSASIDASDRHASLSRARQLFYDATDSEKLIEATEEQYEQIKSAYPDLTGRAEAYLGALHAVRGKHAFMPHNKFIWAMRGLKRMDAALALAPEDLEVLFIHAAVCHHLPFFFARGDDAKKDFRNMIELLPLVHAEYDTQLVIDAFKLIDKSHLTDDEKAHARELRQTLGYGSGDGIETE